MKLTVVFGSFFILFSGFREFYCNDMKHDRQVFVEIENCEAKSHQNTNELNI